MSPLRKTAFAAGALYLLSFVSIPTLFLYNPLRASNYILGHGSNTGIIVGAILEMIVALAGIGTAVALFPVVRRRNEWVGHRPYADQHVRPDLPAQPELHSCRQRPVDRLAVVPVAACATVASGARIHRSGPAGRWRRRRDLRSR